jgi:hypothetical protein
MILEVFSGQKWGKKRHLVSLCTIIPLAFLHLLAKFKKKLKY